MITAFSAEFSMLLQCALVTPLDLQVSHACHEQHEKIVKFSVDFENTPERLFLTASVTS
jgi:hypothetical protein